MIMCLHQTTGKNHYVKQSDKSFENVVRIRYLGTTATKQECTREDVKRRLSFGNACCYAGQNLLFSCLLSKNVNTNTFKTIILPVVFMGVKFGFSR
jgi:hypothetical protein